MKTLKHLSVLTCLYASISHFRLDWLIGFICIYFIARIQLMAFNHVFEDEVRQWQNRKRQEKDLDKFLEMCKLEL